MSMERRGRQNLDLATGTFPSAHRGNQEKQEGIVSVKDQFPDRWARISYKAQDKNAVFENLLSHIKRDSLREAYKAIDGSKALGADRISKSEYGQNLEENLADLEKRIQSGSYKPQAKREVLIPKANGKQRSIAISCFEDKLVDWVVGKILTIVYEPMFIRNSFAYRPGKSAHQAVKACYYSLNKNRRQHVVEIDFSNFFDSIPHRKMMKIIGKRISENKFKGLIGRFLKSELITRHGEILPSEIGTPQGSIMSPILANIYLNEMLDQWFVETYANYNNILVRYADDAVFFFKREDDAQSFLEDLQGRCRQYKLELNEEKTRSITLTKENHKDFNFLGFTFYWGKQNSKKMLKVKTQKEKMIKSIQEFDRWTKGIRNRKKLKEIWSLSKAKILGHVSYYGYWMNRPKLNHFYKEAVRILFRWLNRRSQKKSYTWEGFRERMENFPLIADLQTDKLRALGDNIYAA